MTSGREPDPLERIAAALERIAPPLDAPIDWNSSPAFFWDGSTAQEVSDLDSVPLDRLHGIDKQKHAVSANVQRLSQGFAAHDMLLWGARGMGKSALIRGVVAELQAKAPASIALVQLPSNKLGSLPALIEILRRKDRAFLIFIDDLSFDDDETRGTLELRSVLDGGVVSRPANIRLAVTSNRRALVQRGADRDSLVHERDERDHVLALADRFGLTVGFHPCDQATYLEIARAYADPLGLAVEEEEALAWAISRGSRSGRSAYQFVCELAGRAGLRL